MGDDVTMYHCLSLAGHIHKTVLGMNPDSHLQGTIWGNGHFTLTLWISLQCSPSTTQLIYFLQITAKPLNIIVIFWKLKHSQNTLINLLAIGWGIGNIFQWNFIYNWKVFIMENPYGSVIEFKIETLQLSMLSFIENEMYLLSDSAGINRQMQFIIGMACAQTTLLNHLDSLTHWPLGDVVIISHFQTHSF